MYQEVASVAGKDGAQILVLPEDGAQILVLSEDGAQILVLSEDGLFVAEDNLYALNYVEKVPNPEDGVIPCPDDRFAPKGPFSVSRNFEDAISKRAEAIHDC